MPEPGMAGWLALHFAIGLAGTWLARGYAMRHALIDQPGERRSHDTPTPRGGGIAIVASLLLALAWLALSDAGPAPLHVAIGIGLVLVAGIGWIDDHRPLSPWLRLATHAVAAAILAWGVIAAGAGLATAAMAFVLAVVLVNIWNFMDGIDGLAASQAGLVAFGYAAFSGNGAVAWMGSALLAACAGFLPFNLPKARIFLGDVGSGALGFALAALFSMLALELDWLHAPVLLLPLGAFTVDATLTLGARMVRGERWWTPHAQHAYQRWTRRIGSHGTAASAYFAWTAITVAAMLVARHWSPVAIMATVGVGYLLSAVAWWKLQGMAGSTEGSRE
ncbi:glycosyltransferase family 4 protein [Luteimonas sp. 50]|uniref:Glycosyltransferase family 4 protein n=1 Tax=Cognatiluteimonas sedimenti TaxID=2927791 RepID=A0ABT0A187_9GAMM|nr:glycosyltransferase family 4 protein [Lysobacter sedimenti]MCJ0824744.1 glycosyltransferase family 4 protein [Lysobacter sedimenti]